MQKFVSWFLFFLVIPVVVLSQPFRYNRKIQWDQPKTIQEVSGETATIITFAGSSVSKDPDNHLPVFIQSLPLFTLSDSIASLKIVDKVFVPLGDVALSDAGKISDSVVVSYGRSIHHKKPFLGLSFVPLMKKSDGTVMKLVSFTIEMNVLPGASVIPLKSAQAFAENSVLSTGKWIKVSVNASGIYKITYDDLVAMDGGFATADPKTIKVYGNGGGMLPEPVSSPRIDDLREMSISVPGEEDGHFDNSDYVLFYGESPDVWKYNTNDKIFNHKRNIYSDQTCYFITYGQGNGKRISATGSTAAPPTDQVSTFNDFSFYEHDDVSLIKSGREWYDKENFEFTLSRTYHFNFPDIDLSGPVYVKADLAARSTSTSTSFKLFANGTLLKSMNIASTGGDTYDTFAKTAIALVPYSATGSGIDIKLTFSKNNQEATGWLNYLELNAKRLLKFTSGQMSFRSAQGFGPGKVTRFTMSTQGQPVTIWDVTDEGNIHAVQPDKNGNNLIFTLATDTLREFVVFDGSAFLGIQSWQAVENQNLHATGPNDYLIITHPSFMSEANELAEFHRNKDQMNVFITTPEKIYNEFSSGVQDPAAIRDFARMLFERAPSGKEPRYMLFLGDGSYDYKNRLTSQQNLVPTYESGESLNPLSTYVTDDFYGMMENNDSLDIGVGRFPVNNPGQAQAVINKIKHYSSNEDSVKADYRNMLCFVADDEDNQQYMRDAETVTGMIQVQHPCYNIDKIYLDAYQQVSTPGGSRYPDVNAAVNLRLSKGALIMDYIGHGGEKGWAHERVLEIADINSWTNFDKMPVFVTATCEFAPYDNPDWTSAGELVLLNPTGGGIALFTTTRPTYAAENLTLTRNFFLHAFSKTNGDYPRMGDIIIKAKNASGTGVSTRKFVLLGDPGLQINYPHENVVTTSISHLETKSTATDTLMALSTMTITGEVQDAAGNKLTGFDGTVFPTVYDKVSDITTLANDPGLGPFQFELRRNIIYKGKVDVQHGDFSFSFIVPKDIAYQFGTGRISYYARSRETDAAGLDDSIVVGGYDNGATADVTGPMIRLFMNDTNFISGGMTDQNPKMLALLNDESGINTVGNGIGHDIVITLDNNDQDQKIANDYYTSDANTFKSGNILYPFFSLNDGDHTLRLKVWDVYNNSSEAKINFVVASSATLALDHIFNYPNPFRNETTFSFEYNQPSTELDVSISIYDMTGKLVTTVNDKLFTDGYRANQIHWDGTTTGGKKIGSGNYIYNVKVSTPSGETVRKASRLVVIR